jgi:hypothetical protein
MFGGNVATSGDFAKRNYQITMKVGGADTPILGLGDEASINIMNHVYVRKGVRTIAVHVGGGERDQPCMLMLGDAWTRSPNWFLPSCLEARRQP